MCVCLTGFLGMKGLKRSSKERLGEIDSILSLILLTLFIYISKPRVCCNDYLVEWKFFFLFGVFE